MDQQVKTNSTGQTLIEFALFTPILMSAFLILCTGIYFGIARIWIHHHLYESSICVISHEPVLMCKRIAEKKIYELLPWGRINQFVINKQSTKLQANINFTINSFISVLDKIEISLPLLKKND